jgi:hypothetical protein
MISSFTSLMVLLVVAIMVPNPVAGARLVLQKEIKQFLRHIYHIINSM